MSLNSYGIGFNVSAKDTATPTLTTVSEGLTKVAATAKATSDALDKVSRGSTQALDAAARKAAAASSAHPSGSSGVPNARALYDNGAQAAAARQAAAAVEPPHASPMAPHSRGGDATGQLLNLEKVRMVQAQLERISAKLKEFGDLVESVFERGAVAAIAFGKGISELSTLVPEAQFKVDDMRAAIFAMSRQFGGRMEDQIRAMYQGISAGAADAASATALLTQANKLAIGGVTDVKTAVDGLTNVLNAYGMAYTEKNLQGLSDAFFVGLSKGKTTAAELASTLGMVAPSAAAVGISMSDLIATISAITTKGINTAQAITGMKAALAVISHPAKEASDEAKRLGIEFSEAAIRAKGFPAFLESITKNAKFNADSMTKLFGGSIEAKNAMLALSNGGTAFNDTLAAMKNRLGATDEAFRKMADSPAFQGQLFEGLKEQALVVIGEAILPIRSALLKVANALLKAFTSAPPGLQKMLVYALAAAGGIATLLAGVLSATAVVAGLVAAGEALFVALGVVAAVATALVAAFIPLIAAGATLYLIWEKNLGSIQTQVTSWYNKVSLAFRGIAQLISSGTLSGALQEELGAKGSESIKAFVVTIYMWFGRVRNFFVNLSKSFNEGLRDVGPIIDRIAQAFQGLVGDIVPISKTGSSAKETFQQFGRVGAQVGSVLVKVVGWVAKGFLGLITFVRGVHDTFAGFTPVLSAVWDAAVELGSAIGMLFSILAGGNGQTKDSATNWREIGQVLGGMVSVGIYAVAGAFRVIAGIISLVGGILGAVKVVFDGFVNGIALGVQFIVAVLTGNWSQAWDLMAQIVDNAVNTIVQTMLKLVAGAAGMIDSLAKVFGKDLGLKASVETFANSDTAKSNLAKGKPKNASPDVDTSKMQPTMGPLVPMDTTAPTVQAAPTLDKQPKGFGPELPRATSTTNPAQQPGMQTPSSNAQTTQAIQNLAQQKQQPTEVNVKNTVMLDGAVIAENTSKHQQQQAGRGFAPVPSPT